MTQSASSSLSFEAACAAAAMGDQGVDHVEANRVC